MATDVTVSPILGHPLLFTQGGVGSSPGYDAIDIRRFLQAASTKRQGVLDATGWKVQARAAGANMTVEVLASVGLARVDGAAASIVGPYVVAPHNATISLDVSTSHATLPRIDAVVLQVRDDTHDGTGAFDARVRYLAGTATSGATLDNLLGFPTLPAASLLLGIFRVPAASTSVTSAEIRDYRWHAGSEEIGKTDFFTVASASLPAGWKVALGGTVNRTVHDRLWVAQGTAMGSGDGTYTFTLPNLGGVFPVGATGTGDYTLGATGGQASVQLTTSQLPAHNHPITDPGHFHAIRSSAASDGIPVTAGGNTDSVRPGGANAGSQTESSTTGVTVGNTGGNATHENRPPFRALTPAVYTGSLG